MVTVEFLASPFVKQIVYFLIKHFYLFLKSMTSLNSGGKEMREILHIEQNGDLMNIVNLQRRRNWA